ncbi:DEAD/DEAH box helicase [Myxococcota bacterium]|nr:DEAD/DEAH box helicase [Myxococcota bacterium]
MRFNPTNPLIIQGDGSVLVEVHSPRYSEARDLLARFAELEKSPEHIHTYRITPLSLWNAASAGMKFAEIRAGLEEYTKYDIPYHVLVNIEESLGRFGRVVLLPGPSDHLLLEVHDRHSAREIALNKGVIAQTAGAVREGLFRVPLGNRGTIKQALLKMGYPVDDRAGFVKGAPLEVRLRDRSVSGRPFALRHYQREAVTTFHRSGGAEGGHGVVVLPCGAGKTIVAMGVMAECRTQTLILATGISAVRQWIREVLDKTWLTPEDVGEYTGEEKQVRPVTVTTYQILTHRGERDGDFTHLGLFTAADWGLIVYDEVHLLPAPVFRITADIQARRRLGLTATLVREDGREGDVFTLIGPKRYDVPWKELEGKGFIAEARCHEVRIDLPPADRMIYAAADERAKYRISAENPWKMRVVAELLKRHAEDRVLIIGMYLDQLQEIARRFKAPLITGKTPNAEREVLFDAFRRGEIKVLAVSKVANFSIDLPDANVAIQVSGTFGSRQEEAQRLGRILRPKEADAWFYSVVTRDSREQHFAHNRQLFLTEQGYSYYIEEWDEDRGIRPVTASPGLPASA